LEKKINILVVDDDAGLALNLRDILEDQGYPVTIAHDGSTALMLFREKEFELALIDIKLPDISGTHLIDQLISLSPQTEFILITGHASLESAVDAVRQKRIASYEVKPIDIDRLISFIGQLEKGKRAEKELREYQEAVEGSQDMIAAIDRDYKYLIANKSFLKYRGKDREQVIGRSVSEILGKETFEAVVKRNLDACFQDEVVQFEMKYLYSVLGERDLLVSYFPIKGHGSTINRVVCIIRDITESKRAESETKALREQFLQAQKMEAIGQLAGGFAHDFNNSLTLIKVSSQLALMSMNKSNPLKERFESILAATERAESLARQLLAFSRRQVMEMKVLDLNALLRDLDKMLHRVIGEHIEMRYALGENLGRVRVDAGQIEQVVINLALNARDAMPQGGKLTIETVNVELDQTYKQTHQVVIPGRYVMLAVSDTGEGMMPGVQERIFEPFFTTKEKGKGTGLGLSTAYGIVKQSGGYIWVYSELGIGTTFKIYLPREDEPLEVEERKWAVKGVVGAGETVLLVEDEKELRRLTAEILWKHGYKVLEAADGDEALLICEREKGSIHLMVTDMMMPGMTGRKLAECASLFHPEMKVLYVSGYSEDAITQRGIGSFLEKGATLLKKPFSMDGLTQKVREVLDKQ
jgi:two-component system cell cycle sensor histidine kinase/response regulator CckA